MSLLHNRLHNSDTRGGEPGFETLKFNAEMGTSGVKLVSVDCLQQLDVMPSKAKRRKIQAGQLTLSFGHPTDQGAALQLSRPSPSSAHPEEEPPCDSNTEQAIATSNVPQERRGDVASWRSFAESKCSSKHPWLVIQSDGVYCRYCSHAGSSIRSGSVVFVTEPFTGCRPDKLAKHEQGKTHQQNEEAYREWQTKEASRQTLPTIFYEASMQMVDEKALMYGLQCMYYLNERNCTHNLLKCLGYFDPRNVEKATPTAMLEVREMLSIDGHKLWQEFTGYKSLVKTLPKKQIRSSSEVLALSV